MSALRRWHRWSACVLALFFLAHIGNHLAGIGSQTAHMNAMAVIRPLYRNVLIEPLLLALIVGQALSGLTMLWRRRFEKRDALAWLQQSSGLYLSLFLLIHVSAVLVGRIVFGLDTDFRYAAAGFHVGHWIWFFAPYYFIGVLSLFVHAGCGLYWNLQRSPKNLAPVVLVAMTIAGLACSTMIVLMLAGSLYSVDIPEAYRATYGH